MRFLDGEIWRPIPNSNRAEVSNMGRIKRGNKLLTQRQEKQGYLLCSVGGSVGRKRVHQFVAEAFVENPNPVEYSIIDHISGDKTDNRASNLRWTNASENQRFRNEQGLTTQMRKGYIALVNAETMEGKIYKTVKEAAEDIGTTGSILAAALNGRIKTCKGHYAFRLTDFKNTVHNNDGEAVSGLFFGTGRFAEIQKNNITIKITDENDNGYSQDELRKIVKELMQHVLENR